MSATSNTFDDPDDRSEHLRASPPLLPWPMLDRFTRVHPAVPALLYLPVVAVLVGYATERLSIGTLLAWGVVGYGLWTLTEYWLHRVVFHFEPEDGVGAKLHWLIHGVHHEHPNDPNRLVMPPSASIPLAAIFLVLYRVLFGAPEDELGRLFDHFFRGGQGRGRQGSGLGLAVVRQVAEAHGATVSAANAPGGGLVVRLAFAPARDPTHHVGVRVA